MHSHAAQPADAGVVEHIRREIREDRLELPLLPNVAAQVLSSSVDDSADAARLATLIQQDQSLATHVLRVANSPAFRGATEIVALQQAIARLGMDRIRDIALSASLGSALLRSGPFQSHAGAAWRVALAAGLWAKEVARDVRKNVEVGYLCGLLHDIGTPLVLHRLGELAPELAPSDLAVVLAELAPLAGERLARTWSLPEAVAAAIAHLSAPERAGTNADAVAVAACGAGLARGMDHQPMSADALRGSPGTMHLDLYPEDLETLLRREGQIRLALEAMIL